MAFERKRWLTSCNVPYLGGAIPTSGDDALAMAEKRHGRNLVGMADEEFLRTEIARGPDLHHSVQPGTGQKVAVPRVDQAADADVMSFHGRLFFPGVGIAQADCAAVIAGRQRP